MRKSLSVRSRGEGRLVFILGHPLGHSLSPDMQNAAFQYAKLPWLYLPLDLPPARLKNALAAMRTLPVEGANVTVPYKGLVMPLLDGVEREAEWLGSVNTLYRKGKKILGTSTDGEGFLRSLGPFRKKLSGSRGLLLGAGGAARAVAGALVKSGIKELTVANRSARRAAGLIRLLCGRFTRLEGKILSFQEAEKNLSQFDWVIQGTALGLRKGDRLPLSLRNARPGTWIVDLIYNRKTEFLKEAKERRLPRLDGKGMLLHQGALAFQIWTGKNAPLHVMRRALLSRLDV